MWFPSHYWALPVLLAVVTGGAKHRGSGDVGEGAVRRQVLAGSAFLCPAWPVKVVNCFVFCPSLPALPGAFWMMAKMVRRKCAFCAEGEAGSVMYIATERDIAAHQDCLVSAFSWYGTAVEKRERGSFHCLPVLDFAMMPGLKG